MTNTEALHYNGALSPVPNQVVKTHILELWKPLWNFTPVTNRKSAKATISATSSNISQWTWGYSYCYSVNLRGNGWDHPTWDTLKAWRERRKTRFRKFAQNAEELEIKPEVLLTTMDTSWSWHGFTVNRKKKQQSLIQNKCCNSIAEPLLFQQFQSFWETVSDGLSV